MPSAMAVVAAVLMVVVAAVPAASGSTKGRWCTPMSAFLTQAQDAGLPPHLVCVQEVPGTLVGRATFDIHYGSPNSTSSPPELLSVAAVYPSAGGRWHSFAWPADADTCWESPLGCSMVPADAVVITPPAGGGLSGSSTEVAAAAKPAKPAAASLVVKSNPVPATAWTVDAGGTVKLNETHDVVWMTVNVSAVPMLSKAAQSANGTLALLWAYGAGDAFTGGFGAYHFANKGYIPMKWPAVLG